VFSAKGLAPLLLVLMLSPALAQRTTSGVLQPDADGAWGTGAQMVESNPAGLGFGSSLDLALTYTDSGDELPGQGLSAFFSWGVFSGYHTALGLQLLDPPGTQDSLPAKISWAHAFRFSKVVSLGLTWHTFVADEDPLLDGLDTWDVGLQLRPSRWLAAGLTITDLTTPLLDDQPLQRGYELALAFRPGTERLTASLNARFEGDPDLSPTFGSHLQLRMFGPWALVGRYDTTEIGDARSHRLMVGLADLGHFGVGMFYHAPNLADGNQRAGLAVTTRLRRQIDPMPALFPRPIVAEVVLGTGAELAPGGLFTRAPKTPFLDQLLTLRRLSRQPDVAAVLLAFGDAQFGWGQAHELRAVIAELRAHGKKVFAWLPMGDSKSYLVASAADRIYTTPAGGLFFTGVHMELTFLGDLLAKLGVSAQFVGIGDYKTAPEMFTRSDPSPASNQMQGALLDDLFAYIVKHVAHDRGLKAEQVRALIDQAPFTARAALDHGLVDGIMHYDEFDEVVRASVSPRARFLPAEAVLGHRDPRWGTQPAIGLLYAVGTITDGDSVNNPLTGSASTGADTFIRAVRRLREDRSVKSVVLRIDSPGGSVTAADAMWRELSQLASIKPLIVSMGDVAASGGYYIAAPGAVILAPPTAITGSIGIFTGKFDLSGLMNLVGLSRARIDRGEHASILSTSRGWTPDEVTMVQRSMEELYELFLDRVMLGRTDLERGALERLARGRVWTGRQALACGLVDRPEGLLTAIDLAAIEAGLGDGDYRLLRLPEGNGLGGLPRSPVKALGQIAGALSPSAGPLALPLLLSTLVDLPLLHFRSGQALALFPFAGLE
jgi:protease IV